MYDKKMDETILETIRGYYPDLTEKELEVCRRVTVEMWNLQDIQSDIKNGYL